MPDDLTEDDLSPLAAEYVLGSLDSDERTRAGVLLDVDPQFRAMVLLWERRLGELHLMVEPVMPESRIWERIRGKIGQPEREHPLLAEIRKSSEAKTLPPAATLPLPPGLDAAGEAKLESKPEAKIETEATPRDEEGEPEAPADAAPSTEKTLAEIARDVERYVPPDLRGEEPEKPNGELALPDLPLPAERRPDSVERVLLTERKRARPAVDGRDGRAENPLRSARRSARRWRVCALMMMLLAVACGGLIATWRYAPGRLPAQLRPEVVLNLDDAPSGSVRKAPTGAFDE